MKSIHEQLRAARLAAKLSQDTLAKRAGLTQNHISKIESGSLQPSSGVLNALASAMDYTWMLVPKTWTPGVHAMINGEDLSEPKFQPDEESPDEIR